MNSNKKYQYSVDFEIEDNIAKSKGCSIIAKSKVNSSWLVGPKNKEV